MLISTKGRYALRVLIDLAEQPQDAFVPLKEIAKRQEISEIWGFVGATCGRPNPPQTKTTPREVFPKGVVRIIV